MSDKFSGILYLFLIFIVCIFASSCSPGSHSTRTLYPTSTVTLRPSETFTPTLTPTLSGWDATLSIWHSWDENQVTVLEQITRAFQDVYPNVRFDVRYVPPESLEENYYQAAYNGVGPTILFGKADWGPQFYNEQLIADLTTFIADGFQNTLVQPAIGLGRYKEHWINMPYALSGIVLYRNQSIISLPSSDYTDFVVLAESVTQGGVIGADLDRGIYYSGGHLYGLGGSFMDEACDPTFNNDAGLEWIGLLRDFKLAGPTELNTNRDVRLFKEHKAGVIIEGTWERTELAQAVGASNLVIDPWPRYKDGSMSGFVWAESLYLNVNALDGERAAAIRFMSYFFSPEVQTLLAEVGFIPSVISSQPRDALIQQAVIALSGGVAYPTCPENVVYWDPLSLALYAVFKDDAEPAEALQKAALDIEARLLEIRTSP